MTTGNSFGSGSLSCKPEPGVPDQFPVGLRVLVVDDDVICLKILEQMLRRCSYHVTTCCQATGALNLLRERKGYFDVVLSDVHMPDMDGFKLLELVGLEMDLPVIMMSADGRTNLVLRGIRHGACDYLIKPIREEQLKNIWQHVIRKKWNGIKETTEPSGSRCGGGDDNDYASSVNVSENGDGILTCHKKRRNINIKEEEDEGELETDEAGSSKKPRVVWSVELHQQFVSAVNQLGIDKAVPKRILELMNVPGLTRENVASHLQKFRLYLKRLSSVGQQQQGGGISNSFCGSIEQTPKLGQYGRFDQIQSLAVSGQIPPQALVALHAELLGRPTANVSLPVIDRQPLLQPSNITKKIPQPVVEDVHSGLGAWHYGQNGHNMLMGMLQSQSQSQSQQVQKQPISVQPSRLVVPTQSAANYQVGNKSTSFNILPQSDRDTKTTENRTCGQNIGEKQIRFGESVDEGHFRNVGFVGRGTSIPSRFAVNEAEFSTNHGDSINNGGRRRVKQECFL